MTRGDQQESLWAESPEQVPERQDEPRPPTTRPARSHGDHEPLWFGWRWQPPGLGDVTVRWEWDEPEPSAPRTRTVGRRALALGALVALASVLVLATVLPDQGIPKFTDVPSYWDDVTMTCSTARVETGDRALELFRCHAVDGGRLPPGVYRSPETVWTSDITRRQARATAIEISPDGELRGWAAY